MYTALYMPADTNDPSRKGFSSVEEAEAYVVSRRCFGCSEFGFMVAPCDAEWWIVKSSDLSQEELDEIQPFIYSKGENDEVHNFNLKPVVNRVSSSTAEPVCSSRG